MVAPVPSLAYVNYWLKLAVSAVALAGLLIAGHVSPLSKVSSAVAEEAPTIVHAATNGSVWAGADAAGTSTGRRTREPAGTRPVLA